MRTIFFLIAHLFAANLFCQQFDFKWSEQTVDYSGRVKYLLEDNSHYYFTRQTEEKGNSKIYLEKINKSTLKVEVSVPVLEDTEEITEKYVRFMKSGDVFRLFYRKYNSQTKDEQVMCKTIDATCKISGDPVVIIGPVKAAQVDWTFLTYASCSQDSSKFFIYALYFDKYTDFKTLNYVVLDKNLTVLKKADDRYDRDLYLRSSYITNAGNPVVLLEESTTKGGVLPVMWFYDAEKNEKKSLPLVTSTYAIYTVNNSVEKNGKMYVFSFVKSKNLNGEVEGYYKLFATEVDPVEQKITIQKKLSFDSTFFFLPKEEMTNTKSDRWMNNDNSWFNLDFFTAPAGGFVISLEQMHYAGVTAKKQYAYDCGYLHVIKVNQDLDLVWTKAFPKIQEGMELPWTLQSHKILFKENDVFVVYNDAKKNFDGKNKLTRLQKSGQAEGVLVKIDEGGNASKLRFAENEKLNFYPSQAFYISDNNMLLYTEKDKLLRWASMRVK